MSLSNPNELEEKMQELTNLLIEKENGAYACGFNQSLYKRIIKAFIRPQDLHKVIELIQSHIDRAKI